MTKPSWIVAVVCLRCRVMLITLFVDRFDLETNWDSNTPSSVPLYRRQPQNQTQDSSHNLVDEKVVNGSSGAFAGYARAAITQQSSRDQDDSGDELLANIQRTTTYASVLRTHGKSDSPMEDKGDPFSVLRDLGNKATPTGLYHYFPWTGTMLCLYVVSLYLCQLISIVHFLRHIYV